MGSLKLCDVRGLDVPLCVSLKDPTIVQSKPFFNQQAPARGNKSCVCIANGWRYRWPVVLLACMAMFYTRSCLEISPCNL